MITQEEHDFACEALTKAEQMMGLVMLVVTRDAPSRKAERMAQLLVTAGLLVKLGKSRRHVQGLAASLDSVLPQLEAQWERVTEGGDIDLGEIVFPDADDDYINGSN